MNQLPSLFCVIGAVLTLTGVTTAGTKRGNASSVSLTTNFQCSGQVKCYCSTKAGMYGDRKRDPNPAIGFTGPDERAYVAPRIVGGIISTPNSHPHQISFQRLNIFGDAWRHSCGGSILKPNIILTAAHCIEGRSVDRVRVVAGAHDIFMDEATQQIAQVDWMKAHPRREEQTFDYDYAIVRLKSPLTFDSSVQPIKLAKKEPITGNCTVSGWGWTTADGSGPEAHVLMEVDVPIVNRSTCANAYASNPVTDRMICAGSSGKGSCRGDSGGPLVCGGKLVGVVSWGKLPCVPPKYPGVYANVANQRLWIEHH